MGSKQGRDLVSSSKSSDMTWPQHKPSLLYVNFALLVHCRGKDEDFKKCTEFVRVKLVIHTFWGLKSYFTQCWKPLALDFREVTIRHPPTKCAE